MTRRPPYAFVSLALLASCNAITGIDDVTLVGDGGTTTLTPPVITLPAQGVTITEVAVYQGPKRSLTGGTPPPAGVVTPIVAGRDALVRVFLQVDDTYDKSDVTAQLLIGDNKAIEIVGPVETSVEDEIATTLNFEVPGDMLVPGVRYAVELTQPSEHTKGDNPGARLPTTGMDGMGVESTGDALKILMLPVSYGADGSNRLPDTSEQQMQGYRDAFYRMYPAAKVELVMHEPMQWNKPVDPSGIGWDGILDAVAAYRQQEGTPKDTYVFGFFNPADTFDEYCSFGCVAGLGMIGMLGDDYSKAAVGVGYTGNDAFTTAIHEIGHTQGRQHADCGGAQNIDPKFPYPEAGIGVWGYDLIEKALISPTQRKDMMGYCDPYGISDYTYRAIFDRMKIVNQAKIVAPPELVNRTWERARVGIDGSLTWLDAVAMEAPPRGEPTSITVIRKAATSVAEGHFIPYDHIAGGVLLWPKESAPINAIQVTRGGVTKSLAR